MPWLLYLWSVSHTLPDTPFPSSVCHVMSWSCRKILCRIRYQVICVQMRINGPPTSLQTTHSSLYSEEKNQSQSDVVIALPISTHRHTQKSSVLLQKNGKEKWLCVCVFVSVLVSLVTVISFLSATVDLPSVCFYGFSCRTMQARGSVFFICFLSEWINLIIFACEAKWKEKEEERNM